MRVLDFFDRFSDEQSCRDHFRANREKTGVSCKKCDGTQHYWLKNKSQWQCASCKFRTTLRSGTMMENSNLPFLKWYQAIFFMTYTKKGMSACELQRQLGHSRYDTIWSLMHRIRNAMGNRDARYTLEGMVEFDEAYFEKSTPDGIKLKRGKGSEKQQNVAVMAESTPLENLETGVKSKSCRYYKMKVLDTHKKASINETIKNNIDEMSIVFSDKSASYVDIENLVDTHIEEKSTKETTATSLRWVHIAITNAKCTLAGIYHKIKGKYLQLYLDEFCYKLNRRYFGSRLFDRTIIAVLGPNW
jgi:transposase-like protein